jgi:hypothetical protein
MGRSSFGTWVLFLVGVLSPGCCSWCERHCAKCQQPAAPACQPCYAPPSYAPVAYQAPHAAYQAPVVNYAAPQQAPPDLHYNAATRCYCP